MKKITLLLSAMLLACATFASEAVYYTLTPTKGTNSAYADNCDIKIGDITWNLTGNSGEIPWRIGGKAGKDKTETTDRTLYSKTALNQNVTKIVVTHGNASSITVNSFTLLVGNADFSEAVTYPGTFTANSTSTFTRPEGDDWSNKYYKFVYNVTFSGNSSRYLQFSKAEFYYITEDIPATAIEVSPTSLDLVIGEKSTLTATLTPANATDVVEWTTSAEGVATVENGVVTAVGEGTATITATSVADNTISAACTVTVTAKTAPEGAVFFETFDQFAGVGGNDGTWSDISTTPAVGTYDNEGWTAEGSLCAGYACVSIRKGGTTPSGLTTPAIGHAGIGKVMFNAESWGTDGTNFFVDIIGGGTFVADGNLAADKISNEGATALVAMAKKGKWTTFTLSFKDFTATSKLRFYAPAGKRAFLDEVVVFVSSTPSAIDNANVAMPAVKTIENGQLIILRDAVKYNAMGVRMQ